MGKSWNGARTSVGYGRQMLRVAREQHWAALGLRVRQGQSRLMAT